jgi:glycosyltransferase involved in cell wall biosynthesis
MKTVIVMPAYNAAKTVQRTYEEIPPRFREHVILVDDASRDNTVEVARGIGIQVFPHPKNRGYGGNQKTCYTEALKQGADIVVMVHPDHQYDARVIPDMVQPIVEGRADAVFGSRMLGGMPLEGGMPMWKYVGFRRYLTEIHSGFRAYSRKYLETVRFMENSDDFIFDTEIIAQGMACGLHFREVPIVTRYFPEASSISFRRSVKYGFGILAVLVSYLLHRSGMRKSAQLTGR